MTNIKIVEHVVQELPSERPLVRGEKYKVMQPDGTLIEYVVNSQGEPVRLKGITNDESSRLNRLSSDEISKLEGLDTQDVINNRIDTKTANAAANVVPIYSTVLPRGGDDEVSHITATGVATLLGDSESITTYTNTGTTPSTIEVSIGHQRLAYYDKASDTWEAGAEQLLPTIPLSNMVNQEEDKGITPKGVDDEFSKIRTPTKQLLDKSTFVFGYYDALGNPQPSSVSIRSQKMDLKTGETKISVSSGNFPLSGIIVNRVFFWQGSTLLAAIPVSQSNLSNIDIPAGADSWAINVVSRTGLDSATDNEYSNTIMANYGEEVLPYEGYGFNIIAANIGGSEIEFEDGINLIDKRLITYGYWTNEGDYSNSSTTISTPKIDIDSSKQFLSVNINYALAPTILYRLIFWDNNGDMIDGIEKGGIIEGIEIPANAASVAVNITSVSGGVGDPTDNVYVNTLQLEYGSQSTPFQSFGKKISKSMLPSTPETGKRGVEINISSANAFTLTSYHDNGQEVQHTWVKNNKVPQYDDGWRPEDIYHQGRRIAQGSFNWIHMVQAENEGDHVGTGHGCETMLRVHFYVDGKEFIPANQVGETITGTLFHFDMASVIYKSDHAETTENWNGSNVVPRHPLEVSTYHYMIGEMGANSKSKNYNKLVSGRDDDLIFARCYLGMHFGYKEFFDRVEISNIENTVNDLQTQTAIEDSTTNLLGATYDTGQGYRGELACRAISYSDRFGYVMKTEAFASKESERLKTSIFWSSAGKAYFQPVVTSEIASQRGIPVDVFKKGDVLEGTVYRELHV